MTDLLFYAVFLFIGFFAGIASGLLGIGGGVIFIPSLLFLLPILHTDQNLIVYTTIATSLFAASFSSFGSCFNHFRKKNVELKIGVLFASGSVITALIIPHFVVKMDAAVLRYIVAVILFIVSAKFLFESKDSDSNLIRLKNVFLFPLGVILGSLAGLTGIGGGSVIMPVFHYLFALPIKRAVGTSSFVVTVTVIITSISYAIMSHNMPLNHTSLGFINLPIGLLMGIGALAGSYFGVKMIFKFNSNVVKKIFAFFLVIAILKIIF